MFNYRGSLISTKHELEGQVEYFEFRKPDEKNIRYKWELLLLTGACESIALFLGWSILYFAK